MKTNVVIVFCCLYASSQNHDLIFPPTPPTSFELTLDERAGIARVNEVVQGGVPLPRTLNLTDTSNLAITTLGGTPVAAAFEILGRWDRPLSDTSAPIQWLLISFIADCPAMSSTTYLLITNGTVVNPAPSTPISLSTVLTGPDITQVIVDTGPSIFRIGNTAGLFDSVEANATSLLTSSDLTATVLDEDMLGSQIYGHGTVDEILIERTNDLTATVVVRGRYTMPPRGDSPSGQLLCERQYTFLSGSPTTLVRQVISWAGSYCDLQNEWPYIECDFNGTSYDTINGIRLDLVRNQLAPSFTVTNAICRANSGTATRTEPVGGTFAVQQLRRPDRFTNRAYTFDSPLGGTENGEAADRAYMAAFGPDFAMAVAFNQMHFFEPQRLAFQPSGTLDVDLVSEPIWISGRQGFYTEFAFSAFATSSFPASQTTIEQLTWSRLNQPLRPWPSARWFASSNAVEPFPWLTLNGPLAQYDVIMDRVMTNSRNNIAYKGLFGMMTYGSYPRYWADSVRTDELDCADPTPGEDWDNAFWCGAWTDYHNTIAAVPMWVMRSGDTEWLDELAFPGAKRMLYTQVMQCDDGDGWFYCGQAPAGYGGYRSDFNSSHAYWDNLILYYWLTGDQSVIRTIQGGASNMQAFLCASRPGSACGPEDTIQDYWAQLTGRSTSQWYRAFRFLGLASDDPTFLEDWHANLARALTQHYVEQQWWDDGFNYGFWLVGDQGAAPYFCPPWRDPSNPGDNPNRRYWTDQLWMSCLYDLQNVYTLKQDTLNAAVGVPLINPSQVIAATARMQTRFAATLAGAAGDPTGDWPNTLWLLFDETNRIGGLAMEPCSTGHIPDNASCINRFPPTATSLPPLDTTAPCVEFLNGGGDPLLYDTGKASLTGNLVRGGLIAEDTNVIDMGRTMTEYALDIIWNQVDGQGGGSQTIGSPYGMCLGKLMGEYLARLHSAVALLAAYDAGTTNCAYPSVAGSNAVDCVDLYAMRPWWRDAISAHPMAQDLNGNGLLDMIELVAVSNCALNCP